MKQAKTSIPAGPEHGYDLIERCAVFGEQAIVLAKQIPVTPVTASLISQLVRAATSFGANYGEDDDAESKKDFRHKIGICLKESKECKHWVQPPRKRKMSRVACGRKRKSLI